MGTFRYIGTAALIAKALDAVEEAVTESAEDLVGKAQDVTPVDTGTLKASIHVDDVQRSGAGVTARVATGGESSEYSIFVHEGTSKMAAHKFLEGPLLDGAPVYREAMRRAAAGKF